jgi:3-deoxy-D-manno-octulosonic-acid transferase
MDFFVAKAFDFLYALALMLASPWLLVKSIRQGKYREGWLEKLTGLVPRRTSDQPCFWFHAVSVGEVKLLEPILQRLQNEAAEWEIVISVSTQTGYHLARKKYAQHLVFYCPLDFSWGVDVALKRIRPSMLILAELEIWPNMTRACTRQGIPVVVANGRLSENSYRGYRRFARVMMPMFRRLSLVLAQNQEYAQRFESLGVLRSKIVTTGSVKFDGAVSDRKNSRTVGLARLVDDKNSDVWFLAGSTQAPEEQYAIDAYTQLASKHPELRMAIIPRHAERFEEVAQILEQSGVDWERRSRLGLAAPTSARVVLIDTIGELGAWWGVADIAFVGGSFGDRGGQNMIEPAGYGAAVCFGPQTRNFKDIVQLLDSHGAAKILEYPQDLTDFVEQCIVDPSFRSNLGEKARRVVIAQQGAADQTVSQITRLAGLDAEPLRSVA